MANDNAKVIDAEFQEVDAPTSVEKEEEPLNNVFIKLLGPKEQVYDEPRISQVGLNSDFVTLIRKARNETEVNQTIIFCTKNVEMVVVNEIPPTKKDAAAA